MNIGVAQAIHSEVCSVKSLDEVLAGMGRVSHSLSGMGYEIMFIRESST